MTFAGWCHNVVSGNNGPNTCMMEEQRNGDGQEIRNVWCTYFDTIYPTKKSPTSPNLQIHFFNFCRGKTSHLQRALTLKPLKNFEDPFWITSMCAYRLEASPQRMATFQRRHSLDLSLGPGLMEVIEGVIGRLNTASCSLRVTRKDSYLGWWERNCPRWSDLEGMRKSNVSIFIRLIFCIVWTTTAFLILYTFVISLKLNMLSISGSYVGRCWRTQEFAGFGQPA